MLLGYDWEPPRPSATTTHLRVALDPYLVRKTTSLICTSGGTPSYITPQQGTGSRYWNFDLMQKKLLFQGFYPFQPGISCSQSSGTINSLPLEAPIKIFNFSWKKSWRFSWKLMHCSVQGTPCLDRQPPCRADKRWRIHQPEYYWGFRGCCAWTWHSSVQSCGHRVPLQMQQNSERTSLTILT